MFKKKFKVRVVYFGKDKYTVNYTHYRIIPLYSEICFWFSQTLTGNTECWSTKLFTVEEAERLAKSLTCIEDVEEYYKPSVEEEATFKKDKAAYHKESVPYTSKQIL